VRINGMVVHEGEIIGMIDGNLKVKGKSPSEVVLAALGQMDTELYEIITLYYGESINCQRG